MGVFTYETKFTSVIAPPRLFKALVLDADNLVPKIAPQAVKSAEIVEGDGGVGTIKKTSFGEGSEYSYVKHQVDALDKDNFVYNGGSIIKNTSNYHTKGDVEIKEEHVKAGKERAHALFKLFPNLVCNVSPDLLNSTSIDIKCPG
ncbi:hypothetical protein CerSpe_012920 [Prunus speciosa]